MTTENRSEKLRQDRRQHGRSRPVSKPRATRSRRAAGSASMPPVMVRGGLAGAWGANPVGQKSRPKRRFDVALGIPGAEMRLPSLPMLRFSWRILSFALAVGLAFGLYHLWTAAEFRVSAPQIHGLNRITPEAVDTILRVEGEPVFTLSPALLEAKLREAFAEFSSVSVTVEWPASLSVTVEERVPLITWRQAGITYLVDAEGVMFRLREGGPPAPALTVESMAAPPVQRLDPEDTSSLLFLPPEMVSAVISLGAQAPAGAPLMYDQVHGLGWRATQGWEVYFGDIAEIGNKLQVYITLAQYLQRKEITPRLISVEYPHMPYYRLDP